MEHPAHHPDGPHAHELPPPLRSAVDQVRAEPAPADAEARALDRAERLGTPTVKYWRHPRRRLAWAGAAMTVAATLLFALGFQLGYFGQTVTKEPAPPVPDRVMAEGPAVNPTNKDDGVVNNLTLDPVEEGTGRFDFRWEKKPTLFDPETASGTGESPKPVPMPASPEPADRTPGGQTVAVRGFITTDDTVIGLTTAGTFIGSRASVGQPGSPDATQEVAREVMERLINIRRSQNRLAGSVSESELADQTRELKELWSKLPEEERNKAVYYLKGSPADGSSYGDLLGVLGGEDGLKGKDAEKKPGTGEKPQVWRRDRGRPTFARVYVGDGNSLGLVSLHVHVTVEGPRARTVVDHVFHNPHDRQLEGTFEYPLPAGASPSYFAMFLGQTREKLPPLFGPKKTPGADAPGSPLAGEPLAFAPELLARDVDQGDWGKLQEARIVPQDRGREEYENIVRGKIDPALLEYAGGNTFRGRVFPIPAKGYNRVLIAYEETLPVVGGRQVYRFPLPGVDLQEMRFTLRARADECREPAFPLEGVKKEEKDGRLLYTRTWDKGKPEGEVAFSCKPANPRVQAVVGSHGEGSGQFVYARLRPDLPALARGKPFASRAVFLLDVSHSEAPDRFEINVALIRKILEADPDIQQFNILTFNVGATWLLPGGWMENTPAGREKMLKLLDGIVLEGATDLSCALDKLSAPGFAVDPGTPVNVFLLSDGHITWGEEDVNRLVSRFEQHCPFTTRFHCYRTGLGQENADLYAALVRRGGGVYGCLGAAQVDEAAQAHRRHSLHITSLRFAGSPQARDLLVAGRQAVVHPGGELIVAARLRGVGTTKVVLEGTFQGKLVRQEFPLEVGYDSTLAPRAWGEVTVASLLALQDPALDTVITAYCQEFGIASRVASFLVLENDADFKRLNLEAERGKTIPGDVRDFLEKAWDRRGQATPARQVFAQLLARRIPAFQKDSTIAELFGLLGEKDCELPTGGIAGALARDEEAGKEYLASRARDPRDVHPYLTEAGRRAKLGDADGAVRALSGVVEQHPGRSDALRLVGYRLLDLGQPGQAARLFARVLQQRPFEAHSYRDLARALEPSGNYGLAALQYEAVLAGTWHARFGEALRAVVREEYVALLREAAGKKGVAEPLQKFFARRLGELDPGTAKEDLRVTISWNTDATDVDLWVFEPDGTKVFYSEPNSPSGGALSQDQTQGYGPERYHVARAPKGTFRVLVHSYSTNPNLLGGETHVQIVVTRRAGGKETVERHTVILKKQDQVEEVCRVKF